jgi:AcrR family transcriptional regulator
MDRTSTRPGGRTARVRAAVLQATGDALAEGGLADLDLTGVARRAGVGRTTVYRRWGSVSALVADLLVDMAETSQPRSETGDLDGDLRANARLIHRTLTDHRQGPLFRAMIAAAAFDASTAAALHAFYATRIEEWAACVDRAVERGDVPVGTDSCEVIRAVSAPLYYRFLVAGGPLDEAAADQAAAAAAAAARAGSYVRR